MNKQLEPMGLVEIDATIANAKNTNDLWLAINALSPIIENHKSEMAAFKNQYEEYPQYSSASIQEKLAELPF